MTDEITGSHIRLCLLFLKVPFMFISVTVSKSGPFEKNKTLVISALKPRSLGGCASLLLPSGERAVLANIPLQRHSGGLKNG